MITDPRPRRHEHKPPRDLVRNGRETQLVRRQGDQADRCRVEAGEDGQDDIGEDLRETGYTRC